MVTPPPSIEHPQRGRARRARRGSRAGSIQPSAAGRRTTSTPARARRGRRPGPRAGARRRRRARGRRRAGGRAGRSPRGPGSGPATRRTVRRGSSPRAVRTPTSTASASARQRCRWQRPSGPEIAVASPRGRGDAAVERLADLGEEIGRAARRRRRAARRATRRRAPPRVQPGAGPSCRPALRPRRPRQTRSVTCACCIGPPLGSPRFRRSPHNGLLESSTAGGPVKAARPRPTRETASQRPRQGRPNPCSRPLTGMDIPLMPHGISRNIRCLIAVARVRQTCDRPASGRIRDRLQRAREPPQTLRPSQPGRSPMVLRSASAGGRVRPRRAGR